MDLQDLDLFKLLRLSHLTNEQKTAYMQKILALSFAEMATKDLPQYLSVDEIKQFTELANNAATKDQALDFLRGKFPDFDNFFKNKMLAIKKDLVRANIEERLDINKVELEELSKVADGQEKSAKLEKNSQEKANLDETLKAIDVDDWQKVSSLITP